MSIRFMLSIPLLLVSTWFGGMVCAASTQGTCPGGSMNATQYSFSARTTSGQLFRPGGFTAAHRTLPFGTRVKVANPGRAFRRSSLSTIAGRSRVAVTSIFYPVQPRAQSALRALERCVQKFYDARLETTAARIFLLVHSRY